MTTVDDLAEARALLGDLVAGAGRAVVFTGAGVSTESGIPDFRSPGGIWSQRQPIYFDDFLADEDARLEDWHRRFEMRKLFDAATPNTAHRAIAGLVQSGIVGAVITQNIDGLHQRSGVPEDKLIELHGNATSAGCLDCGAGMSLDDAFAELEASGHAPRCFTCGGLVKARVVSFGQPMPVHEMGRAEAAARDCDLFIAAGSSLVVYPAAGFPLAARMNGATLVIVNRDATEQDQAADYVLRGTIGAIFEPLAVSAP
ncbi:SIR2 family NAD-dependent protein deacylase [Amorphus coralli]|uniref:SIR2 family NAD-dependent protein deacylase n=1 Tax=Amorphus coralli TaxID=340680 RepID=UPI0003752008|nr:Sir2 family NAD-dependent protein deacetylase [Amorphus coralli]